MRSLIIRSLVAGALVSTAGCIPFTRADNPLPVQPVQVKKAAPVKKAAAPKVAAPVQKKVVKKPIVPATPTNERSDSDSGSDSGPVW